MKRFSYVCADPGIPIPGSKGASIHVASVCSALVQAGLTGNLFTPRREAPELLGLPIWPIRIPPRNGDESQAADERRLFMASLNTRVASSNGCDFIYERYSLWHAGGLARSRELGVPFILEVNSPLPDEARRFRSLANPELAEGIARLLTSEADGIVCVSKEVASWVIGHRGHDRGVWVVPNGVDPELFSPGPTPRPEPLPQAPVPLVAFSGSFRPWHGVDDLLEAFKILVEEWVDQAHMLCVGDGPLRRPFEQKARELGLSDRIHITGALPHHEVPLWLGGADVAVAPYPELDSFYFSPLKIFEFLSLGLPVVAANVGQVPEISPHLRRGLLYTPGKPRELAEAIAHLLRNRTVAERLGRAGRAWVLEHATWSKRVGFILSRIEEL